MAFRFVHTADIHLDSPLRSMALRDAVLAEEIGTASRLTFARIVDLCIAEDVDALLIAGDLHDSSQTSMKTARFLAGQLARLGEEGIRVFIIQGNHDAGSRLSRELVWPDCVHVFTGRAGIETVEKDGQTICIHGISFTGKHVTENLLDRFKPAVPEAINIGMLHTSLGGSEGHDPYSPCSLQDLHATGFAYWALGHIHKRSVHRRDATVVMPGIPQGRDIGEEGRKSVTLVDIGDDGGIALEERCVSLVDFIRLTVDISGAGSWDALVKTIRQQVDAAGRHAGERQRVLRVLLEGQSDLCWQIERDSDLLLQECQVAAERLKGVWIDTLVVQTAATMAGSDPGALDTTLAGLLTVAANCPLLDVAAEAYIHSFMKALPPRTRIRFGTSEDETARCHQHLAEEGFRQVLAKLQMSREGVSSCD